MGNLTEKLMEELNCETVFTIPVFGGIGVAESVVVTWIIMAVMVIAAIILTRNLRVDHISRRQAVAETIVTKLNGMVESMIGTEGKRYVPYLATVLVYIGIANIIGLFGFKSPTKDLIMELLKIIVPVVVPAVFCLYFDIFDGLLQAYEFVFLTSLYIKEAVE